MCGHAGFALHDPRGECDEQSLMAMGETISHRGPDDGRVFRRPGVGAVFRRLSIIDLEGGMQPLVNEDETVFALINGEIYNFRELRAELEEAGHRFRTHSDCETLVHLYEEHGEAAVERLIGMFAFALFDLRGDRPRVVLGRDRLGIKPLYYAHTERGLCWGSETKALLALDWVGRRVPAAALLDYFVQGYVGGEGTAWDGISRLRPGCTLSWTAGEEPVVRRYWDLPHEGRREPTSNEEVLEWLDRVVSDRLVADVPLGAFLSGGIDSSAVVSSMAAQGTEGIVACSVGFRERSHNELDVARRTASALGATLHEEILEPDPSLAVDALPWFYDEPLADPSTVPTYLVSQMARKHVTVALSGDGGDEVFAGYRRYVHDVAENELRRRLGGLGRGLCRGMGAYYPKLDWAPRFLRAKTFLTNVGDDPAHAYWRSVTQLQRDQALALLSPELGDALGDYDPFHRFEQAYRTPREVTPLYRAQYADFHTYLPDQILTKVDRASMAVSLEVRVPILDHRFVERFAPLPTSEKVRGSRGKHAFREALRGRVSAEVLDGTKRGFDTPLRSWLRGPLRETLEDAVSGMPESWLRRDALRDTLEEHMSGRRDHGRLLWSVLVLEHWRRRHEAAEWVA